MRAWVLITLLVVALLILAVLGIAVGSVTLPLQDSLSHLLHPWASQGKSSSVIVWQLRLPRVLLGIVAGGSLALCGGVMQGVFRNPLADPYLLGIAAGATSGAALGIVFRVGGSPLLLSLCAFGGGLLAVALVVRVSMTGWGRLSDVTLILAGVAVAAMFSALTSFLTFFSGREEREQIIFWIMGDLGNGTWRQLGWLLLFAIVGILGSMWLARDLNALALGDDMALHLGISPQTSKRWLLFWSTMLTAAVVAVCGTIGFVGLIIPHVIRLLLGPDHRLLLPVATLAGAVFLVSCDILSRLVARPNELPIGLVTAMFGAPFFLYLLHHHQTSGRR